jgi:hypothetical protein
MEFSEIFSIAIASLIVLVLAHFAAYWVVRTLYPPTPNSGPAPVVATVPVVSFTEPPKTEEVQHVVVPTYEAPVPTETPRQEEPRRGPPPPESTSIHGNAGNTLSNAQ